MNTSGQKQRVALARAVYHRECSLVLLDDVLSALDAHTSRHILQLGDRHLKRKNERKDEERMRMTSFKEKAMMRCRRKGFGKDVEGLGHGN